MSILNFNGAAIEVWEVISSPNLIGICLRIHIGIKVNTL